ncbi:mannose-6-phosphate isomerase, class I [Vaginisenegalia massiliensis]|uniref:mannose-6-phosphate isomerase, class I n=1 Tax=Vaginisenegalia massiliensis TaxID=2058294 RepID=UPI000F532C51|nr:mannose-6-phosphate isomerase, class I [Vaginisenegalia massiliensis]
MKEPIFLATVLQEKIWGGNRLASQFKMDLPSDKVGEAWVISAHPNGISRVISPKSIAGLGLDQLYTEHAELFGNPSQGPFPLLVKILDAAEDLSVQVHPDDQYGLEREGELGKTECWYVIAADPGAKIVYGHKAQNKQEFLEMIEAERWSDLLTQVPVKAGDFFYVPHGTIHAIGGGIMILETQQNSDTTYRVYDYDRIDKSGQLRPLHIEDSAAVTRFPHTDPSSMTKSYPQAEGQVIHYLTNDLFSVYQWQVQGSLLVDLPKAYYLATVIEGQGWLEIEGQRYSLDLADSFILPHEVDQIRIEGNLRLIASNPEN